MADINQEMKDNFQNMPIDELLEVVNNKSDDYTKDAIKVAYQILKERQKPKVKKNKVTVEKSHSNNETIITDIKMPFGSMVEFMVKWAIASIPAFIILLLFGLMLMGVFGVGITLFN